MATMQVKPDVDAHLTGIHPPAMTAAFATVTLM